MLQSPYSCILIYGYEAKISNSLKNELKIHCISQFTELVSIQNN